MARVFKTPLQRKDRVGGSLSMSQCRCFSSSVRHSAALSLFYSAISPRQLTHSHTRCPEICNRRTSAISYNIEECCHGSFATLEDYGCLVHST